MLYSCIYYCRPWLCNKGLQLITKWQWTIKIIVACSYCSKCWLLTNWNRCFKFAIDCKLQDFVVWYGALHSLGNCAMKEIESWYPKPVGSYYTCRISSPSPMSSCEITALPVWLEFSAIFKLCRWNRKREREREESAEAPSIHKVVQDVISCTWNCWISP